VTWLNFPTTGFLGKAVNWADIQTKIANDWVEDKLNEIASIEEKLKFVQDLKKYIEDPEQK
jgi:hypothetical protein